MVCHRFCDASGKAAFIHGAAISFPGTLDMLRATCRGTANVLPSAQRRPAADRQPDPAGQGRASSRPEPSGRSLIPGPVDGAPNRRVCHAAGWRRYKRTGRLIATPTQPCRTERPFLQQNPMPPLQSCAMSQPAAVPGVRRRVRNLIPEEHPAFCPAR